MTRLAANESSTPAPANLGAPGSVRGAVAARVCGSFLMRSPEGNSRPVGFVGSDHLNFSSQR